MKLLTTIGATLLVSSLSFATLANADDLHILNKATTASYAVVAGTCSPYSTQPNGGTSTIPWLGVIALCHNNFPCTGSVRLGSCSGNEIGTVSLAADGTLTPSNTRMTSSAKFYLTING